MIDRWKNQTVTIAACGPSLTRADCQFARLASKRLIAVNNAWEFCRRADALYAADRRWWISPEAPAPDDFAGERWISARNDWGKSPRPEWLREVKTIPGVDMSRAEPICEGANSAFQAMNLAVMWGASRIVFIGLDLQRGPAGQSHYFGDHGAGLSNPQGVALQNFRAAFERVAPILADAGVEVINASRRTALTCFPQMPITQALP